MERSAFWQKANQEIEKYDLLRHPFYQAWSAGELTREDLKFYAEQYFHQVSQFPTYLTSLHSRLPDGRVRRDVLANAYEEECDGLAHSELWQQFAQGMGASEVIDEQGAPIREVSQLVETFRALAKDAPVASVLGALYAYESQVPRIAAEKRDGLQRHYGADERTCGYFAVHEKADVHHAGVWQRMISEMVEGDDARASEALQGISTAAHALWTALDGIERHRPNHKTRSCSAAMAN